MTTALHVTVDIVLPLDLGGRLRCLRRATGLNQTEVGAVVGRHLATISDWERGKSAPNLHNLQKLAELYGVSVDVLADAMIGPA